MKLTIKFLFIILFLSGCDAKKKENAQPQSTKVAEMERITVTINGHTYDYDVVTGATKEVKNPGKPVDYTDKLAKMFWSGKPSLGYIEGDYYHADTIFDGGYTALIDVVKKDGKLVLVEFDEIAPKDYYSPEWAGITKRLSGYGFFQAKSDRTDSSLMTLINGLTFLEHQMLTENRLTGDFKSVKGSSNSVRRAFIPTAARMASLTESPSGKYYYGLVKDMGNGLIARLQVIKEADKITGVKYDEIFEDTPDAIQDADLKQFYRQSKYHSVHYPEVTKKDFKSFADQINEDVVKSQNILSVSKSVENNASMKQELVNYKVLAKELNSSMLKAN